MSQQTVQQGRFTIVNSDDPVTVFLIGMRINAWWKVRLWWPVFTAMPGMLKHLSTTPSSGFLGSQAWLGRTTILVSYWRSEDDVVRFARDPDLMHLPAWRAYNAVIGSGGDVGVWHETYVTSPGSRETVYANMPEFGLGKAIGTQQVGKGSATAVQRMRRGAAVRRPA